MTDSSQTIYDVVGEAGITRLVAAFYRRVATDDVLRAMYPGEDLAPAEERLRLFLIQRFGGPTTYSDQRGHPRLRMRHAPFTIDRAARDIWMTHMAAAMDEAGLPVEAQADLRAYFEQTATAMINAHRPE